jgi:hypothetical protein
MASINASTSGAGGIITTADNTGILNIQTAGTNAVTVDASQRVGIGTTDMASFASGKLVVTSSGDNFVSLQAGTTNASGINMVDSVTGSAVGLIRYQHASDAMDFFTNGSQRMHVNSSGNVGIGTSSQDTRLVVSANTGTAVQRIYNTNATNTYQMSFHNNAQECGTITTGNNTVGYNSNSDYRLKENIVPMTGALAKVAQLNPVTYTWKASGTAGQGFIAHELQEHFPEAVSGEKDAVDAEGKPIYQGMDTSFLVATLTAAIKEQQTVINDLKARIETLENA